MRLRTAKVHKVHHAAVALGKSSHRDSRSSAMPARNHTTTARPYDYVKRCLDLILAATLLILTLPVTVPAALAIRLTMGSPIFFRQARPGKNGRIFHILKFRTMTNDVDEFGNLLPPAKRITPIGRIIRSTSIDELPQLWNVLRGDMSLVGPRPLLPEYLQLYTPEQARRHEVRPGITGWAQVNGRNATTWEQRFIHDVWYVDNRSFLLDVKILAMTAWKVLKRSGISHSDTEPMPRFTGTRDTRNVANHDHQD